MTRQEALKAIESLADRGTLDWEEEYSHHDAELDEAIQKLAKAILVLHQEKPAKEGA